MKDFGKTLVGLGALAFIPSLFGYEWILSSWLGDLQQPIGLAAVVAGVLLWFGGGLAQFRNAPPVASPTDVIPNQLSNPAPLLGTANPVPNQLSTEAPTRAADQPASDR